MQALPAAGGGAIKRRRSGRPDVQTRATILAVPGLGEGADLAQVGLLPEQVALALTRNEEGEGARVLAGVDSRTARAYSLVGNTLYTWSLETAELGRELEAPADRSLELLDRQGYACVTQASPAAAVLAPSGPRSPVAVILTNGRVIWRELERDGARSEYMAQLESGEMVTAATWESVGHDRGQVMAYLGTSHGRVYRVGPLGGAAAAAAGSTVSSGPMAKPIGLSGIISTFRLRGPGPLENIRCVIGWSTEEGQPRIAAVTGDSVHLYDHAGFIIYQSRVLSQLRPSAGGGDASFAHAALLRPGLLLLAAVIRVAGAENPLVLNLSLLDLHNQNDVNPVHLRDLDAHPRGALTIAEVLPTKVYTSHGSTDRSILAYVVHPSQNQTGIVTTLHFHLDQTNYSRLRVNKLVQETIELPRAEGGNGGGGFLGAGMVLRTDLLALLMAPDRVLRVRAKRHTGDGPETEERRGQANEERCRDIRGEVQQAFKLFMELEAPQAYALIESGSLLRLPDGVPDLAQGLAMAVWSDIDLEPDTAPYWGHKGGGQGQNQAYHLLVQHSLRRKASIAGRWLRFLSETGMWAKLTEAEGAALLEGRERVTASEMLCAGLIHGEKGLKGGDIPPALVQLLRDHAMSRWGEDLAPAVRARLEQGGLPPLDRFFANPSKIAHKLASLQAALSEYCRRRAPPVGLKEQIEASVAITNLVHKTLGAAVAERQRLAAEYGIRLGVGGGGWLTDNVMLQVLETEMNRLRSVVESRQLNQINLKAVGASARWLGTLWLDMGLMSRRWTEMEAAEKKREVVLTVEAFGMTGPAMDLARHAEAWDVLGELEFRHRDSVPHALPEDMSTHPEVAQHVLNWLLDHSALDHVLEYGATSALAQQALEHLFRNRPDNPAASRLAWLFYVHTNDYGQATEDLKALADEEKKFDLKKLWVDLGILSDETARRHCRQAYQVADNNVKQSLKEDQDLLQAQSNLLPMLRNDVGGGSVDVSINPYLALVNGQALTPEHTIDALIAQIPKQSSKNDAVALGRMAMDLVDFYRGRRHKLESLKLEEEVIPKLWGALVAWRPDWENCWRNCDAVDPGRALEHTVFAEAVRTYEKPSEEEGGEGQRTAYQDRLCQPTDVILKQAVQILMQKMKYRPNDIAVEKALMKTRNTVRQ